MSNSPVQTPMPPTRLAVAALVGIVARVLRAAGADDEAADLVADSLVGSDLRGVTSHGFIRVPEYLRAIEAGRIAPTARPRVRVDGGAIVALDGQRSFGQLAARELVALAAERARSHGVCVATLAGASHVGRLGEWVERIAAEDLVALAWCNCGDPGGNVVPFGGREARLGTNPMAYAIPVRGGPALVADFSTSIVAEGKVRVFLQGGRQLPDGWLLDSNGHATNDPQALYEGGAILPMGEHKGFGLGLLVEILGGVLAGAGCASLGEPAGNGLVLLAVDPARVCAAEEFATRVTAVLGAVSATPPAWDSAGVVIPGQPEAASAQRLAHEGIPVTLPAWQALTRAAQTVGIDLSSELPTEGGDCVV